MLQVFAIYLLWLSAVFDPVGSFYGFRYIGLLAIFIVLTNKAIFSHLTICTDSIYAKFMLLFCFFLPFYGLFISIIRGGVGSKFIDTSYFASAVYYAATLLFIQRGGIRSSIRAFLFSTRMLSLVIISCALTYYFSSSLAYQYFFVGNGVAYIGTRLYGGVSFYYMYFVASPMLIFLIAHESWRALEKQSAYSLICLFVAIMALFLSGTRFSMVMAVITLPVVFMFKNRSFWPMLSAFIAILLVSTIAVVYYGDVIGDMLSLKEGNNSLKMSYLDNYSIIFNNPFTFIFGQGFNAHEWSHEFSKMLSGDASKVELTYLELIRVFGLFGASFFFLVLFSFFTRSNKVSPEYRWIFPGMALYFLVSSSNPYVFSSNGMLLIGLVAGIVSLPSLQTKSNLHEYNTLSNK